MSTDLDSGLSFLEKCYITMGQPCPALAYSSSINEAFGYDLLLRSWEGLCRTRELKELLLVK